MSELYLMVTIINRNLTKKFMDFYTDTGVSITEAMQYEVVSLNS